VPIIIGCVIYKNRDSLKSDEWKNKFSTLTDDVRTDSLISSLHVFIMVTKWLLTIVSLTVYIDLPALQIGTSFLFSMIYQIYLITVWPHVSRLSNWLDLFNELMVTAYLYGSMSLTDLQLSYQSKLWTSWYLISVIALTATVNSICVFWSLQRTVRAYLQERLRNKTDKHPVG
jgi:hypothetical protein